MTAEVLPEITFDLFKQIDIRTATVISAQRIPKSEKLLELRVSLGDLGTRTIVAGIAKSYMPESVVGMRVLIVANLAPTKLCGVISEGMILAADSPSGESVLLAGVSGGPLDGTQVH